MLKIPASLRQKKRYVYFKIYSQNKIPYENLRNAIWNIFLDYLGELGTAKANIRIVRNLWDPNEQKGIIRCSHRHVDEVKICLGLLHQIGDEKTVFQTLRVSGTIRGAMSTK
ncbi:MAG: ribonuclease P protein component 2 [Candidatus Aenigmarchaeota archaeon]|nr:ribonuclease P protein component 2 [Candidatus Aenigmarchaeota archaeon]